eukprot:symbB.v1.2.025576.t1/scaffold2413.1/size174923/17
MASSCSRSFCWIQAIQETSMVMPKDAGPFPVKMVNTEMYLATFRWAGVVDMCKRDSMVFEIGISFVVLHYQSIFIGVMRCLFQAFRPLLILFIFGQIIKAVFFIAGAPIWMSFYSIWLFEASCSGFPVEIYRLKTWCL